MLAVLHNGRIRLNLVCNAHLTILPHYQSTLTVITTFMMELRAAGLIIYRRIVPDFEYLLLQTSYGHHHWTPPKGHVDKGETDFDAALRETLEEAGLSKNDLKIETSFCKVLNYPVKGRPKIVTYWLAELCGQKQVTLSSEHQDYKWVKLDEACKLAAYPDMQSVLKECEEYLKKVNNLDRH